MPAVVYKKKRGVIYPKAFSNNKSKCSYCLRLFGLDSCTVPSCGVVETPLFSITALLFPGKYEAKVKERKPKNLKEKKGAQFIKEHQDLIVY